MTAERETSNSGYPRLGKPASLLLVILFVALLWLPLLGIPFGWQIRTEVVERRTLVDPPAWGEVPAQQAIKQFMNYFNDRFAFRDAMIYAYCLAQVKLFHVSPSDTVVLGKEGWLYFTGGELIKDHQGLTPPSEQELKQWADVLEGRRAWLAERGIHYMFVLVPNKVTIYPEYLPPGIIRKRDTTRADIVTAYLKEHTRVPFLDLRPVLAEAKRERLVYFPFGTHWNHHGTYKGYAQVARQLNAWYPSKPPIPLEDFQRSDGVGEYACHMLGVRNEDWPPSRADKLMLRELHASRVPVQVPPNCRTTAGPPVAFENPEAEHTLLMVHDSFFAGFMQIILAEHFARSVSVRINLELDHERLLTLVEQEKPDVVIEERVERLLKLPPRDHAEFAAARERARRDREGDEVPNS